MVLPLLSPLRPQHSIHTRMYSLHLHHVRMLPYKNDNARIFKRMPHLCNLEYFYIANLQPFVLENATSTIYMVEIKTLHSVKSLCVIALTTKVTLMS